MVTKDTKKRLYLHHPQPDETIIHRSITRYIPPTPPPVEEPRPVFVERRPSPPRFLPPPPPPEPEIEVISVDVEPEKRKRSRSRHSRSRSRNNQTTKEIYIEKERVVPVPYPYPVESRYETVRYVEAPRVYAPPPPPPPPRLIEDRERVTIEDRRRVREYYER